MVLIATRHLCEVCCYSSDSHSIDVEASHGMEEERPREKWKRNEPCAVPVSEPGAKYQIYQFWDGLGPNSGWPIIFAPLRQLLNTSMFCLKHLKTF